VRPESEFVSVWYRLPRSSHAWNVWAVALLASEEEPLVRSPRVAPPG